MIWISANHTSIQYPTKIQKYKTGCAAIIMRHSLIFIQFPQKNEFVKIWANVWLEKNEHG